MIFFIKLNLLFLNWVNNNIIVVSQLLNSDGYLYSYSEEMWQMKITTTKNIQILIFYAPFVRQKINICPIFLWECTYTNLFWKVFLYMLSLHIYFLLYKEVLFGCHNFTKEDKDKYYLITLFIFLAKLFLHKCKFQCAKPYFSVFWRTLNPTWTLFLHPIIPKPLKRSHYVIWIIFSWFCY